MAKNNRVKVSSDVELKDRLVAINRTTKVTKGGRTFTFAAIVVVGDGNGVIGYGLGKANEVTTAIAKGVEVAKKNLANCSLKAPVSGIVGKKNVKAGETALPSQAVVTILNINTVKVKVSVPEAEVNAIQANTTSEITVEAANRTLSGGSIEKSVQADPLTHSYNVRITVANTDHKLLPGMVANVCIGLTKADTGLSVPITAVQRNVNGRLFVWTVANDSTAHRTIVSVGATLGNNISIISGISDGQRIVTEGYQKLSEGTKVVF